LDGAAYLLEGVRVGTGELVPAAAGGNGERWSHKIVLSPGDPVDVDGDGAADADYSIYHIADGVNSFAFAPNGDLLVRAYVKNGPVGWEALLRIPRTIGVEYCPATGNASGVSARTSVVGSERVTDDDVRLRCTGVAQLRRGIFLASRQPGYIAHPGGSPGNLCIGAPFVRLGSGAIDSGAEGVFELPLILNQVPNPSGGVGVMAGESWYFTTWFRDFAGSVFSSQFSSAIRVTLR
jgi:hypothetical protein